MSQALSLMKDKGLFEALQRELSEDHVVTNRNLEHRLFSVSQLEVRKDRSVVLPRRNSISAEEAKRGRVPPPALSHEHFLSTTQLRSNFSPKADRNRSIDLGANPHRQTQLPQNVLAMATKRSVSSQKRFEKQLAKFSKAQADRTA